MKIIRVGNLEKFAYSIRPKPSSGDKKAVESIIKDVQKNGDIALKKYEKKFSGIFLKSLRVDQNEIRSAYRNVSKDQITALRIIQKRLAETEVALKNQLKKITITSDGTKVKKVFSPIESVGCYVPGGLAKYPTSLIMAAVPAKIAGVKRVVVVSPTDKNGKINPLTLVAADLCKVKEIYKIGGAQAIAALTFGTKSIPSVNKIVGPGGSYVTFAKSLVRDYISIDMIAGPTELCIIADEKVNLDFIVNDLFAQSEHSEDTFCYVLTKSEFFAKTLQSLIRKKISKVKRQSIVEKSLSKNGFIAVCKNDADLIKLANLLAPEHIQIMTQNSKTIASKIKNAGLVLVGAFTPSAASDYLLGSNHILPTSGFGKTRGSLSTLDFMKIQTEVESSPLALKKLEKIMKSITDAEGLENHYESVRVRL